MPFNRFAVNDEDHGKFGKLIKKWARGDLPMPNNDLGLFKQQLVDEGIGVQWPWDEHEIENIHVSQTNPKILEFKVPPVAFLNESEEFIRTNGYPLPGYYSVLFDAEPDFDRVGGNLEFHNMRTGDYTVANCV